MMTGKRIPGLFCAILAMFPVLSCTQEHHEISIFGSYKAADGTSVGAVAITDVTAWPGNLAYFTGRAYYILADGGTYSFKNPKTTWTNGVEHVLLQFNVKSWFSGYVSQVVDVPLEPGVFRYNVPVVFQPYTKLDLPAGAERSVELQVMGRRVRVTIGPLADKAQLQYASLPPENGPGMLREAGQPTDMALQSGGMFFLRIQDYGNPDFAPLPAMKIAMDPYDFPEVKDSQPAKAYRLGTDGQWTGGTELASEGTSTVIPADGYGFWNCDRNYRTACLRGKVTSGDSACQGARVQVSLFGTSYSGSTGSDGSYCVNGPQGLSPGIRVGGVARTTANMPSYSGDCTVPDSCGDGPTLDVEKEACAEQQEPEAAGDCTIPAGCSMKATIDQCLACACEGAALCAVTDLDSKYNDCFTIGDEACRQRYPDDYAAFFGFFDCAAAKCP